LAPTPSGNTALSQFNGANPNGTWQLFIRDDAQGESGQIARGWSLEITALVDKQITEQVPVETKAKKKKKKR
jgi:subtilisin-like proprotein convertase family protein